MITRRFHFAAALLTLLPAIAPAQERSAKSLSVEEFDNLHRLIKPRMGEANWEQVRWMPSNDIWAARQKAAKEGKPILLWYMAGEPLGTC